jgi:hypothetical protein
VWDVSAVRNRRRRRRAPSPSDVPLDQSDDALPLEEMGYDPQTMGDPPGAHGDHPDDGPSEPAASSPRGAAGAATSDGGEDDRADAVSEPRRARAKRPSVPSWDDIVFGTRPPG